MRAIVSWSSGKDSALALYTTLKAGYEILGLLVTVDETTGEVTGHRVPLELVREQAKALNLPLYVVNMPGDLPERGVYEARLLEALRELREMLGLEYVVYGDIHLRDVMEYKRNLLSRIKLKPLYPLEGLDPVTLTEITLNLGFKSVIVALDPSRVDVSIACKTLDKSILKSLQATVDPAGEYGEYHTFTYYMPLFSQPISYVVKGVTRLWDGHLGRVKVVCELKATWV